MNTTRICAYPGCDKLAKRDKPNSTCSKDHSGKLSTIQKNEKDKAARAARRALNPIVERAKKLTGVPVLCACGCGEEFIPCSIRHKYVSEKHEKKAKRIRNKSKISKPAKPVVVCACGCGETFIQITPTKKCVNRVHAAKYRLSNPEYKEKYKETCREKYSNNKEAYRERYEKKKLELIVERNPTISENGEKVPVIQDLPVIVDSCSGKPVIEPKYNEKGERVCQDCGVVISMVSARCFPCANISRIIRGFGKCERCGRDILLRSTQRYCKDCTLVVRKETQARMNAARYNKPVKGSDRLTMRIEAIVRAAGKPGYNPAFPEKYIDEAM